MRSGAALCVVVGLAIGMGGHVSGQGTGMQVTKPSDREIVVTQSFAQPRQRVFDALTRPDQVPRWFQPSRMSLLSYESDLRDGGSFRYVFQRPSGKRLEMRGIYSEVDAPRRWVHTETYDFSPLQLRVTTVLDEVRGRTVMTQTILYQSKEERDGDFDAVAGSAAESFEKLEKYLESAK